VGHVIDLFAHILDRRMQGWVGTLLQDFHADLHAAER
jgi:hypothetical protein